MSDKVAPPPEGITEITLTDLKRFGVGPHNALYFDGKRVETRQRVRVAGLERVLAVAVSIAAVVGGLGAMASGLKDGSEFLCGQGVHWLRCAIHEK